MQRTIGRTGIEAGAIGFGVWQLSNHGAPPEDEAVDIICRAVENGAGFLDTSDCYCTDDHDFGHNEELVHRALHLIGGNFEVTVATKAGIRRPAGAWVPDGRPERILGCCAASLERLGLETITLYQLHEPDPKVPIEETIGAFADLQSQGKIEHVGVSNVNLEQLQAAESVARIESVQNKCNPWHQVDFHNGVIDHCMANGITYLAYHPVGGKEEHAHRAGEPLLRELASRYSTSTYCILLSWLLSRHACILPIPGASRLSSVLENLTAPEIRLDREDVQRLTALGQGSGGG